MIPTVMTHHVLSPGDLHVMEVAGEMFSMTVVSDPAMQDLSNMVMTLIGEVAQLQLTSGVTGRDGDAGATGLTGPPGAPDPAVYEQLKAAQKAVKVLCDQVQSLKSEVALMKRPQVLYEASF